jgi:hypothetical protein
MTQRWQPTPPTWDLLHCRLGRGWPTPVTTLQGAPSFMTQRAFRAAAHRRCLKSRPAAGRRCTGAASCRPGRRYGRTARPAAACPAWPWRRPAISRVLAVPPADRDDHRSVGQGELVQVVVVPAGERVIDRLAELLERRGAGGDQHPTRPGPQVPGVYAVHQLHCDRQMSTSHLCLHHKLVSQQAAGHADQRPAAGSPYHQPAR